MWASPNLVPELLVGWFPDLAAAEHSSSEPAYFTAEWSAGQTLARFVLDHPEVVRGRRVFELGCGSGLVALAAKLAGAAHVVAVDRDPRAVRAVARNAEHNGLVVMAKAGDPVRSKIDDEDAELFVAADVLYEAAAPDVILEWLSNQVREGREVIVADPGRLQTVPPMLRKIWELNPEGGATCTVYRLDLS